MSESGVVLSNIVDFGSIAIVRSVRSDRGVSDGCAVQTVGGEG